MFSIHISFILIKFKKVLDYVLIKYRFDLRKDEKGNENIKMTVSQFVSQIENKCQET